MSDCPFCERSLVTHKRNGSTVICAYAPDGWWCEDNATAVVDAATSDLVREDVAAEEVRRMPWPDELPAAPSPRL